MFVFFFKITTFGHALSKEGRSYLWSEFKWLSKLISYLCQFINFVIIHRFFHIDVVVLWFSSCFVLDTILKELCPTSQWRFNFFLLLSFFLRQKTVERLVGRTFIRLEVQVLHNIIKCTCELSCIDCDESVARVLSQEASSAADRRTKFSLYFSGVLSTWFGRKSINSDTQGLCGR